MHNVLTPTAADAPWMARALQLAAYGLYTTGVNPRVGCVLVVNGQCIGEGWHERAGEAHAEVMALADAQRQGFVTTGATAYVTLEPCAHFGKTPPCAEALIKAGIARVVVAMADPNPLVAGKGVALLQAAGIVVAMPLMATEAEALNPGFIKRMRVGLPWVRLKMAGSLDGRSALANGQSQWITSADARADGHRFRARAQALVTGIGTVLADDPQLTVRDVQMPNSQVTGQPVKTTPSLRVVVDSHWRTSPQARLLGAGALIATGTAAGCDDRSAALTATGAEILHLPGTQGRVDLAALLRDLAQRGINEVHVEAGATLSGAFIHAGLVDELLLYMAPCLLGADAHGWFADLGLETLAQKVNLQLHDVRMIGPDIRILARFQ